MKRYPKDTGGFTSSLFVSWEGYVVDSGNPKDTVLLRRLYSCLQFKTHVADTSQNALQRTASPWHAALLG